MFKEIFSTIKKETSENESVDTVKDKDPNLDQVIRDHDILSYTTIDYRLPEYEGRELKPGHKIIFSIPDQFRHRIVRDLVLKHRKATKYQKDIDPGGYDPYGAYSLVELNDLDAGRWVGWKDPEGYNPIKFAEPRSAGDPENEVFHDWVATVGRIKTDQVRVTNVGKDQAFSVSQIHGLEVIFFPELEDVNYDEKIYSSGTEFIDLNKNKTLPSYGGGERTGGIYEKAVVLNGSEKRPFEVTTDSGRDVERYNWGVKIKLKKGKLVQVEAAVGDTEYFGNQTSDKNTRLGWAKLWVGIKRKNSNPDDIRWFIKNANVPPQGVIAGGPHIEQSDVNEGDELVIESRADTTYLMGWRLAYKNY